MNIKQDHKNARLHSKTNEDHIKKSIEQNGYGRSIVVDNEGIIIAGNGVYSQTGKDQKIKVVETDGSELIVVKRTDLSYDDEKRRALAIADNATSDLSEWDFEELTEDEIDDWCISNSTIHQDDITGEFEELQYEDIPEAKELTFSDKYAVIRFKTDSDYNEFVTKNNIGVVKSPNFTKENNAELGRKVVFDYEDLYSE